MKGTIVVTITYLFFYVILALSIVWLLSKLKILPRARIFASFLVPGVVTGLFALLAWPEYRAVILNPLGVRLGDEVYEASIKYFGDP